MSDKTAVRLRYLDEDDMVAAGVTDIGHCVDVMAEVWKLMSDGDYRLATMRNNSHGAWLMFPESSVHAGMPLHGSDRRFMAMPAYLGGQYGMAGVKWYGSNIENKKHGLPRSILMFVLNDRDTGAPLAFMSANLLSAIRTGAKPGTGARYFAREDATTLCVIGPGVMNRTTVRSILHVRPSISRVQIKGRSQAGIDAFKAILSEYPNVTDVVTVDTDEKAIRGADIITIAVNAPDRGGSENYPLVKKEWLNPGAFLALAGDTRVDDALLESDVLKIVDDWGQYEDWADMFPAPRHDYVGIIGNQFMDEIVKERLSRDEIVNIGDILTGKKPGKQSDEQICIFSIGGLPTEDVAWATEVYRNALDRGIGVELPVWEKPKLA